jgi:hypothetical protein
MTMHLTDVQAIEPAMVFGFFDDFMDEKIANIGRDRLDQRLLDELSEIGTMWELLSAIRLQQPINPGRKFTHLDAFKAGASHSFFRREVIDFERIMKSRPDPQAHPVSGRVLQRFNSLPLPTGKKDANRQKKVRRAAREPRRLLGRGKKMAGRDLL